MFIFILGASHKVITSQHVFDHIVDHMAGVIKIQKQQRYIYSHVSNTITGKTLSPLDTMDFNKMIV